MRATQLPMNVTDNAGNQWMVYANGMVQQQGGNAPVFAQLGNLSVNGGSIPNRGGVQAMVDDRTGEVLIENLSAGGVTVTRRILLDKAEGVVRFVDTFRAAPGGKEVSINVNYTTNINFGIQQARMIPDTRAKDQNIGWAAMTHGNRALHMTWAGAGAKVLPRLTYPEGSNVLQVAYLLTVPAGKEVSVVHLHGSAGTLEQAAELVGGGARGQRLVAGLESGLRRTVVNVRSQASLLPDDLEVLRGDVQGDVVEVGNGDQLRGRLVEERFAVRTAFGRVELPVERLLGVVTVGRLRPMQLLVSREGEVFGGVLEGDGVSVELSSGQVVRVPLLQVSRVGMRLRADEPEELAPLGKPLVALRTGERMAIVPPAGPMEVATRYGVLRLPTGSVAEVVFRSEESPVHVVTLVDGSRMSGLLTAGVFELTLDGAAGSGVLSVPASGMLRLRPTAVSGELDVVGVGEGGAEMRVVGEDVLRGVLTGVMELDTAFETVRVEGSQVRQVERASEAVSTGGEVRVTLWDGTVMTGRPRELAMGVRLGSGLVLQVPVDLVERYVNPSPRPSEAMAGRVRELVGRLNADDFRARESAQQQLIAMGAVVIPLLVEMREGQPPEARQRLEQILSTLQK